MDCPDENTFVRLQAGLLDPEQVTAFERHLDQCPQCTELMGLLGALSDGDSPVAGVKSETFDRTDESVAPDTHRSETRRVVTQAMVTLVHACWAALSLSIICGSWDPATTGNVVSDAPGASAGQSMVVVALVAYSALWGPVGLVWSLVSTIGFWRGRPWAPRAAWTHALISLPSLFLAPLALFVLVVSNRPAVRQDTAY